MHSNKNRARLLGWQLQVFTLSCTRPKPDELRAVFADVFGWNSVDAGEGWLIFALPPAEMGVHPAESPAHQVSMMCTDLPGTMEELKSKGVEFIGEPQDEGFGITVMMQLPGVEVMLYQPRHPTAV